MSTINGETGNLATGLEILRQEILDRLLTTTGYRVMHLSYGSSLRSLVDSANTPELRANLTSSIFTQLNNSSILEITKVSIAGNVSVVVSGTSPLVGRFNDLIIRI